MVTEGYTEGYTRLKVVTEGYTRLQVVTEGY